jgi:hypothetical protein
MTRLEKQRAEEPFHLALLELQLAGFWDLVAALAKKYPGRKAQFAGIVEDALRHLRDGLWIVKRHSLDSPSGAAPGSRRRHARRGASRR